LPLDLLVISKDNFKPLHEHRVTAEDEYFDTISSGWGDALRSAFHSLPPYSFSDDT
jgi:putative proteasome-type protease